MPDHLEEWLAVRESVPWSDVAAHLDGPVPATRDGLHTCTGQRFASCLVDTADPATPVTARAARAYLDVAFFHRYDDGNGRLAGLVLLFVLLRERVGLDEQGVVGYRSVRRPSAGPFGFASRCV